MEKELRVEPISGVAYIKDSTYYSSRGQHENKSFEELLKRHLLKKEEQKRRNTHSKRDEFVTALSQLSFNEDMRKISESIKTDNNEEQSSEVDPRKAKAMQAYENNQAMMTAINTFRLGLRTSKLDENNKDHDGGKNDNRESKKTEIER